jgi:hypothetical protein
MSFIILDPYRRRSRHSSNSLALAPDPAKTRPHGGRCENRFPDTIMLHQQRDKKKNEAPVFRSKRLNPVYAPDRRGGVDG